jgi:hypothetical protein
MVDYHSNILSSNKTKTMSPKQLPATISLHCLSYKTEIVRISDADPELSPLLRALEVLIGIHISKAQGRIHPLEDYPHLDAKISQVIKKRTLGGLFLLDYKPFQVGFLRSKVQGKPSFVGIMALPDPNYLFSQA